MKHFLLIYRRSTGKVSVEELGSVDPTVAMRRRFEAEMREIGDPDVEVVILSAPSPEALRRTHARYFRTSGQLANDLAEALPR